MKLATWNINSLRLRMPSVLRWMELAEPDVLCLQETKVTNELFPAEPLQQAGYQVAFNGQKAYNGVAIVSRHPIHDVVPDIGGFTDESKRVLSATVEGVRVICVYVPNGESPSAEKFTYKMRWLSALTKWLSQVLKNGQPCVITGDFNIAPGDMDVFDPVAWKGHILCSDEERQALQKLLDLGLVDAFRTLYPEEKSFTWWDYREFSFQRNRGARIDHLLVNKTLEERCEEVIIDRQTRSWEKPSDHVPVILRYRS